jgi:hypothetical protein
MQTAKATKSSRKSAARSSSRASAATSAVTTRRAKAVCKKKSLGTGREDGNSRLPREVK